MADENRARRPDRAWRGSAAACLAMVLLCSPAAVATDAQGAARTLGPLETVAAVRKAVGGRLPADLKLCRVFAYSRDTGETNLRAGPGLAARVVATLPGERPEAGARIGPEFQVLAGRGPWFLIRSAHWAGYDLPAKPLHLGPAWMAANLVAFTIESLDLLAEPREGARSVLRLLPLAGAPDQAWGPDSARIARVHGCSGSYVEVDVQLPDGRAARGWAGGLCRNQVTTCGGGQVLYEARAGGLYLSRKACAERAGGEDCPEVGQARP